MSLLVLKNQNHNPQKNLAQEEELKKQVSDSTYLLRFWINDPVLVMGRFQKEEFEAKLDYLKQNNIPLLRRSTGGGTVYHDHGTLNISFCKPKNPPLVSGVKDSTTLVSWIAESLRELGLPITQDDRNALFINEKKILGSAVSLTGEVLLFHSSLLVNTNLEKLEGAINWKPDYPIESSNENFVKSHRSPVINLKNVDASLTMDIVQDKIEEFVVKSFKALTK